MGSTLKVRTVVIGIATLLIILFLAVIIFSGGGGSPAPQMQALLPSATPASVPSTSTPIVINLDQSPAQPPARATELTSTPIDIGPSTTSTFTPEIMPVAATATQQPALASPSAAAVNPTAITANTPAPSSTTARSADTMRNLPAPPSLPTASGTVIYQADFSQLTNFTPNAIGEGNGQVVSTASTLQCVPTAGGAGDGEFWISPSAEVAVPNDATITVRFYTDGAAAGLAFAHTEAGAKLLYLSGTSSSTYLSMVSWKQNSKYPGDGSLSTPEVAAQANTPYAGSWHTIQLSLATSSYHATVDGQLQADGERPAAGTAALYAICDGVAFDTFTIGH